MVPVAAEKSVDAPPFAAAIGGELLEYACLNDPMAPIKILPAVSG